LAGKDVVAIFDGWTDRFSKGSYLGVVARYVDTRSKRINQRVLAVRMLQHPHTHDVIRTCVLDVLNEYGVGETKVVIFCTGTVKPMKENVKKEIDSYFNTGGVRRDNQTDVIEYWINAVVRTAHNFTAHILFTALAAHVRVCTACASGTCYKRVRRTIVLSGWNMYVGAKESN